MIYTTPILTCEFTLRLLSMWVLVLFLEITNDSFRQIKLPAEWILLFVMLVTRTTVEKEQFCPLIFTSFTYYFAVFYGMLMLSNGCLHPFKYIDLLWFRHSVLTTILFYLLHGLPLVSARRHKTLDLYTKYFTDLAVNYIVPFFFHQKINLVQLLII